MRTRIKHIVFPLLLGVLFLLMVSSPISSEKREVLAQSVTGPFLAPEILGRPTDHSITMNIVPNEDLEIYVEYGTASGSYTAQTTTAAHVAGQPFEVTLGGLQANTKNFYRVRYRQAGATDFSASDEHSFWTQRDSGSTFTFDIQGDSHPERTNNQFNATLYTSAMLNIAADQPDFFLTIGDDFSVDTLQTVNATTVTERYTLQRPYLGLIGAPVFLVNGNHEQAALANLNGTANNVAVWAQNARNSYYPQPAPDDFYTGNGEPVEYIGLLRNYYAWTWGDALFVAIDPYWHSPERVDNVFSGGIATPTPSPIPRDLWNNTLGETQYQWFKNTLETSAAKYKFVFAHHVNGTGRGGIELAYTYEWGNAAQYPTKRPTWELPIHQLMAENNVTIFFQGHDHIFARQELDGVIYQSLPEPANPFYSWENADAYLTGDKYPNSGHVRVAVSPEQVTVSYIRAFLPADEINGHVNGEVAYSYTVPATTTPASFSGNIILGRPTDSSVTASVLSDVELTAYLEYGTEAGVYSGQTAPITLTAGQPTEILMSGLQADTAYYYRLRFHAAGETTFAEEVEHSFHTQRPPNSTFTFTLDADPHNRDTNFNAEVFSIAMNQALTDNPDFHIDLGDTFMTEKIAPTSYAQAVPTYNEMRPFFGLVGHSAPLFLVSGNHDGELGWKLDGDENNLAVWATKARQAFYPNPIPGEFYSGSTVTEPFIGVRDGYYAWTWGDALFVVLDPYWYSTTKPSTLAQNWNYTLGETQYQWLKATLETSDSKFKFVFAHNLVGGLDTNMRGGIEAADKFEWGGLNADGSWGLDTNRPGWPASIHELLVQNHVTIFFHGHDHLFVKQDLDGIVYQEVPQPSYALYDKTDTAVTYGYTHGDVLGCCGYMRITVSPSTAKVDYVRAYLPKDETAQRWTGQVSYTYTVNAPDFAPSNISLSDSTVAENMPSGTLIGTLTAADIESNDTFTYALVDGTGGEDDASFSIASGTLLTAASFDYETKSSYALRIRVTDHRGLSFDKNFTVTVTDANDTPTNLSLSKNLVSENQPIGTIIGALTTTDQDAGDTHTYAIACAIPGVDDESFQVSGNNLITNALFDYETKTSYSICLRATDGDLSFFDQNFTISILNLDDTSPTVLSIVRASTTPTAKLNVDFTVAFSEPVTGVDKSDFTLTRTGTLTGASVTSVSGSNATYTVTVSTGTGNGTLRLNVNTSGTGITDLTGNAISGGFTTGEAYTVSKTLVFKSVGAQDGWILESGENTSLGGALNVTNTIFLLGDNTVRKQYRSLLSFNTSSLPDNAIITKVTLRIKRFSVTGGATYAMFQGLLADVKKGYFGINGNLSLSDFQSTLGATGRTYGPYFPPLVGGWYNLDLTVGKGYVNKLATFSGMTQIRLRFKLEDNNNAVANYIKFYSGNSGLATRPQLIVEYYIP